jgi:serine/threonine-protein kinase
MENNVPSSESASPLRPGAGDAAAAPEPASEHMIPIPEPANPPPAAEGGADENSEQAQLATQITDPMDSLIRASRHRAPPGGKSSTVLEHKPPPVLGDFRLMLKLGEGAMGAVYKAKQISIDRDVAVKVLFPHMAKNAKLLERFYREARVMGRLDHPNIVRGYAVDEEQGWHYFAMEYIDGRSLQKWLALLGRISVPDALHVTLACADALGYAHRIEVIHRDIKPDNILITRGGAIKIADFGAVKLLTEDISLTQTGNGIGTPCYMPLEQARNAKEADGRSDIYALGCVLYCTLTGRPPFSGANLVELIEAKDAGRFPPARKINPEVPERLDLIIDKMIAKQIRFRYATCEELIKDLKSLNQANTSLTFVPQASSVTTATIPAKEEAAASPPTPAPESSTVATPPQEAETVNTEWWYVNYKTPLGPLTRKFSTAQVLDLIKTKDFDATATASHTLTGGYRLLAHYREFEHLLAGRASKESADRQTTKYRAIYQKLEEEQRQRGSSSGETPDHWDWATLLYRLAAIAIGGAFVLVVIRLIVRWIGTINIHL